MCLCARIFCLPEVFRVSFASSLLVIFFVSLSLSFTLFSGSRSILIAFFALFLFIYYSHIKRHVKIRFISIQKYGSLYAIQQMSFEIAWTKLTHIIMFPAKNFTFERKNDLFVCICFADIKYRYAHSSRISIN